MEYKVVKENPDLVKDEYSGAVLNTNWEAYQRALSAKRAAKNREDRVNTMENDINSLKEDVGEIKSLLKQLIEK